jgi:hypothetical protein
MWRKRNIRYFFNFCPHDSGEVDIELYVLE